MDFNELHNDKRRLSYAEALVKLNPTNETMRDLSNLRKSVKNKRRNVLKVAE